MTGSVWKITRAWMWVTMGTGGQFHSVGSGLSHLALTLRKRPTPQAGHPACPRSALGSTAPGLETPCQPKPGVRIPLPSLCYSLSSLNSLNQII